jgi:hypothetical protein
MSHYKEDHNYPSDSRNHSNFAHGTLRKGALGELMGEIPIVGELTKFLPVSGGRGIKKICCCCAPVALIFLIPLGMLIYWLIKNALSLFKIDITNINWIEQTKTWLTGNLGLDQMGQWFGNVGNLLGNFSN